MRLLRRNVGASTLTSAGNSSCLRCSALFFSLSPLCTQSKATGLIVAAANDHASAVSLLLDKGANIEARDHVRADRRGVDLLEQAELGQATIRSARLDLCPPYDLHRKRIPPSRSRLGSGRRLRAGSSSTAEPTSTSATT